MEKHTDWRDCGDGMIRRFDPETNEWALRCDPSAARDARIRAAAPDLYAALTLILGTAIPSGPNAGGHELRERLADIAAHARVALARANGGAS